MARLFWVGVGAVGTMVAVRKVKETARRYSPTGVAERVDAVGERTTAALGQAVERFQLARTQRERELVQTLLVTPEGGDAGAVLRRRTAQDEQPWPEGTPDAAPVARGSSPAGRVDDATPRASRPTGRVDEDEPLYEF